jgi:hypothetical protein
MNDGGYYDDWTSHDVIVTGSLVSGFNLRVGGRDKRQIKDCIAEMFTHALDADSDHIQAVKPSQFASA